MEQKNFELFDKFNKVLVWALGLFMFEKILQWEHFFNNTEMKMKA